MSNEIMIFDHEDIEDARMEAALDAQQEHKERMIAFAESKTGRIYRSDDCAYCVAHRDDSMMPPHQASSACESGKYDHCTCDTCY